MVGLLVQNEAQWLICTERAAISRHHPMKRKGCLFYFLMGLGVMLLCGNFMPPLSLAGCAVTPSRFIGQVLDQHGKPVPHAKIEISRHLTIISFHGERSSAEADEEGRFSYFGIFGAGLHVAVSKSGYLPLFSGNVPKGLQESQRAFWGGYDQVSSPRKREVFHLYKPPAAEELVYGHEKSFRMAKDGMPLTLNFDDRHRIEVRTWTEDPVSPNDRSYNWRGEIKVLDGGMQKRASAFSFEAPTDGYASDTKIDMPTMIDGKTNPNWNSQFEQDFFFRFTDGCFGRATIEIISGGDHFLIFEPYLNPRAGSRNLSVVPK